MSEWLWFTSHFNPIQSSNCEFSFSLKNAQPNVWGLICVFCFVLCYASPVSTGASVKKKIGIFNFIEPALFLCLHQTLFICTQGASGNRWMKTKKICAFAEFILNFGQVGEQRGRLDKRKSKRGRSLSHRMWQGMVVSWKDIHQGR